MNGNCGNRRKRLGQTLVEFTFVGIPMIFVLISIFEISRGMWIYHTLAYSVKVGVRYASVHGINCVNGTSNPNNCSVNLGPADTQGTIAYVIRQAAVGLDPASTTLTFNASGNTSTCTLATGSCSGTVWPPNDGVSNAVGKPIRIDIQTPFKSAIAMFWPGAKSVSFASGILGASSQDYVQF
jgi:Flp pilus assembly protein TadG